MKVKIEQVLTKEEIKDIVAEELRGVARKDAERILSNMSYDIARAIGDKFYKPFKKDIATAIKEGIEKLSTYTLFQNGIDHYGRYIENEKTKAYRIMEKCVEKNEKLIEKKVLEAISKGEYADRISFEDIIMKIIKGNNKQ